MEKFSFTSSLLDQDDQCIQQTLDVLQGKLGENYISKEFFETYISREEPLNSLSMVQRGVLLFDNVCA